jgi:hypothetical protein
MSTVLSKFFRVRPEDQIFLKITIGHAQIGTTMVSLAGEQLASDQRDSFKIALPKDGKELAGKSLFCSTIVTDVRSETNQTSVTYELIGGENPWKQTLSETVESENDSIFYVATIKFYC